MNTRPLILAITGASGAIYAIRLLEQLLQQGRCLHLVISESGRAVMRQELGLQIDLKRFDPWQLTEPHGFDFDSEMGRTVDRWRRSLQELLQEKENRERLIYHDHRDFMAPIASGSFLTDGMVVCPCSGGSLSAIVNASSSNLIHRAADVQLKESRKLILVPRETPLSVIQLENMKKACQAGAVVLPAAPGWYHGVRSIADLADFVAARILDQLQVPHQLMQRWGEGASLNDE